MPHLKTVEPRPKLPPCHPSQQFFPEVISPLEAKARWQRWNEREKRIALRKPKKVIRVASSAVPSFDMDLLDLPLFRSDKVIEDILDGDPFLDESENPELVVEEVKIPNLDDAAQFDWSEDGVIDMHWFLLKRSLERLEARNNAKEKKDILGWIFYPDVPDEVVRVVDGKEERILIPFTFGACCRLEGADPEIMREKIAEMCLKIGVAVH